MATIAHILEQMGREPANVRFVDLRKVCEEFFGPPRQSGSSHMIFKTPWVGDPRINIQNDKAKRSRIRSAKCCWPSRNCRTMAAALKLPAPATGAVYTDALLPPLALRQLPR